jgi:hypothetical protein
LSVSYKLGEIEPRERAGSQTARKYEYQYERTARATLNLLTSQQKHLCVYCDWHDDYVVELESSTAAYEFHQVKGRKLSQGPWSFREFFGIPLPASPNPTKAPSKTSLIPKVQKPIKVTVDAIFTRMVGHRRNFGGACSALAFITNAGIEPSLSGFLTTIKAAGSSAELVGETKALFERLGQAYVAAKLVDTAETLHLWLGELRVFTDQGNLESSEAALLELADVIVEFSEIDLLQRQSKQIAREVVSLVRRKVAHTTTLVPAAEDTLRQDKGLVISDILKTLSLSSQAYEQLKKGDSADAVKTLSRLQRYCEKHQWSGHLVNICDFKARWDVWRTVERHALGKSDYILLEEQAMSLLRQNPSLNKLVAEAKDIAKQFAGLTSTVLTPENVMGLFFSLAAQSESLVDVEGVNAA